MSLSTSGTHHTHLARLGALNEEVGGVCQGLSRGNPQLRKLQTCLGLMSASGGPPARPSEPARSLHAHCVPCTPVLYMCCEGLCEVHA